MLFLYPEEFIYQCQQSHGIARFSIYRIMPSEYNDNFTLGLSFFSLVHHVSDYFQIHCSSSPLPSAMYGYHFLGIPPALNITPLDFVNDEQKYHFIIAFISLTTLKIFSYLDFLLYELCLQPYSFFPWGHFIIILCFFCTFGIMTLCHVLQIFFLDNHFVFCLQQPGAENCDSYRFYFIIKF